MNVYGKVGKNIGLVTLAFRNLVQFGSVQNFFILELLNAQVIFVK